IVTSDLLPVRRNIMVREAYFDAPNLGRLIQDVWNNPGFVSPDASKQYHPGCGAGSSFTGLRRHT
ncbi:hypothetical protein C9122_22340, partial [Escherichia coli]|uniref:hypothetical protein n=1 Tax=Escherichia coli TaxID=562 RepID=UPI0010ACD2FF